MENNKKTIEQIFNETQTDYIIIAIDETRFWIDEIQNKINKAFGVYLCKNEPTNLCSFEVNYPCTFLYNSFERKPEFEESDFLDNAELNNNDDGCSYYLSLIPNEYYVITTKFDTEEKMLEYYNCNHVL